MPHENNKPAKSCFRDATAAHDAETVRLVREWIRRELRDIGRFSQDPHERGTRMCCQAIRSILNRPAKKGKKNG